MPCQSLDLVDCSPEHSPSAGRLPRLCNVFHYEPECTGRSRRALQIVRAVRQDQNYLPRMRRDDDLVRERVPGHAHLSVRTGDRITLVALIRDHAELVLKDV